MINLSQHEYQIYLKNEIAKNTPDKYDEYGVNQNGKLLKNGDSYGY